MNVSKRKWTVQEMCIFFIYMIDMFFLYFTSSVLKPVTSTKIVVCIMSVVCIVTMFNNINHQNMKKYHTKPSILVLLLISMYSSFAAFGHRLFLSGNVRIHCSLPDVIYYFSGAIWFIPVIFSILFCIEWLSNMPSKELRIVTTNDRRKSFWTLFSVLAVVQVIILVSFWPGGFPNDALDQLRQAVLGQPLNDWHPVLHTLMFKFLYMVIPNAGCITFVQMFLFTLLCTKILMIGYDKGLHLRNLCIIGILFLLFPNQAISNIGVVKDQPYTMALLWGTYLLFRFFDNPEIGKEKWFIISFAIDLFLIYSLRHNGIMPVIFMIVTALLITMRYFKQVKCCFIISVIIGITCMGVYKGPIFDVLDVQENIVSSHTTMLCAVGSCINKDLPLSKESNEILEKVTTMENWKRYYNRFEGHNDYRWGDTDNHFKVNNITLKEAFIVYFDALSKYPDVIIKDRLDGTDILWDIHQPNDSYNTKGFDTIYNYNITEQIFNVEKLEQNWWGAYYNDSVIANIYRNSMNTSTDSIWDMLLWRSGPYLILFIILILFCIKNNLKFLIWSAVPMIGNIAGSLLVLYSQSFRYVYFVQIITLALLFLTICMGRKKYIEKNKD